MICAACRRENPPNVQFYLGCGNSIDSHVPPTATIAPVTPLATSERAISRTGAAVWPFGLVFSAVVTFCTALSWLLGSGFLTLLIITESAANSNVLSGSALVWKSATSFQRDALST